MIFKNVDFNTSCSGYCVKCKKEHSLFIGNAYNNCLELIEKLNNFKCLDFEKPTSERNPKFSTDYVFGEARGQMFGVLECISPKNETVFLKAFSCKYNSQWNIDGWVPPLFDADVYMKLMRDGDSIITPLGDKMRGMDLNSPERLKIHRKRKRLSQELMKELHQLYSLHNFRGEKSSIYNAFYHPKGIPTGTGDCCAPKLLNFAALNNLTPISIAEFFYGKENVSQTRSHGKFYSSCKGKCEPILGFMLCGLEE